MLPVDDKVLNYVYEHSSEESELLQELVRATNKELEYSEMLSGRVVGNLLKMLVRLTGARRVLEIGTFTGYSSLSMAEVLPEDGEVITCDMNERYQRIAKSFFRRSEHGSKITQKMGPALETLETLGGPFDLVFIDADKNNYPEYYEKTLPMVKTGGMIVVDNALWSGKVVDPPDENARAIDRLNKRIAEDDRVFQVLLTVRDGLNVIVKK